MILRYHVGVQIHISTSLKPKFSKPIPKTKHLKKLKKFLIVTLSHRKHLKGYKTNIEKDTLDNNNFRKVLYTSKHIQLVLMTLRPGEEIGAEVHGENDQFFRIEGGHGKCIIDDNEYEISDGDAIVIPTGSKHNIINVDTHTDLKMYTLYAPPHHKDGILRPTKKEAEENEAEFDGKTTE